MSDDDYNQLTKELGMKTNLNLRRVTGSEAGSEFDNMSDRGGDAFTSQIRSRPIEHPATAEYFAPDSAR